MTTYPPAPATLSDPNLTVSKFLAKPNFVARRFQQLSELRFVGAQILKGRADGSGGAIGYDQWESIFADSAPEPVAPGSEYTLTTTQDGPSGLAKLVKNGKDTLITDENVSRRGMAEVDKNILKLVNSAESAVDASIIALVASAITANRAAAAAWNGGSAKVLQDILRAKASVRALQKGYNPDVLLVDDDTWAYLASDAVIASAMVRESQTNPVYTGRFEVLAGLQVIPTATANLPGGVNTNAWVLDSRQLGFIATEDLGGGYQQATELVQTKVMREDGSDAWRLRERTNLVPVVTDPGAGFKITGVMA